MLIEALYRDNHKERFLATYNAKLGEVVKTAESLWDGAKVKHLKIIDIKDNERGPKPDQH